MLSVLPYNICITALRVASCPLSQVCESHCMTPGQLLALHGAKQTHFIHGFHSGPQAPIKSGKSKSLVLN